MPSFLIRLTTFTLLLAAVGACSVEQDRLTLVKPRLAVDLLIAEEFAHLFDSQEGLRIDLIENPYPDQPGIELVKQGIADLALAPNTESYDPRVTTVVPLYSTVLHIAYRAEGAPDESVLNNLGRLKEATVFAGPPGSPSRMLLEATARKDGIRPDEINYTDERTDCADFMLVYTPVLPEVPEAIRACGTYRLYSLGRPEDIGMGLAVDSMSLRNPILEPFVIPAGTYDELTPEPVVSLSVDKLLVARAGLSETTVYDLLRETLRMKPALSASDPGLFHGLTDDFEMSALSFVMHPGALAYLNRDEPDLLERYSGVAEVLVTLMIGLISGIYAIWRIISIGQKNRIDAFCREAIERRDQYAAGEVDAATTIGALKELQDRAYDLMIRERLAADESFQIFITLANDIIADVSGAGRQRH